jgi:hypothetical protein
MIEAEMAGASFTGDNGDPTVVRTASCTGEAEPAEAAAGPYTHFRCQVVYDDGYLDEVIVHLLEEEIFFKSTGSYQP